LLLSFPDGGEGGSEGPALVLAPIEFPKTTVGAESPSQEIDVFNAGGAATVEKVAIEGPDMAVFKATNNCNGLSSGAHCLSGSASRPAKSAKSRRR
jgi:hypothetical protein